MSVRCPEIPEQITTAEQAYNRVITPALRHVLRNTWGEFEGWNELLERVFLESAVALTAQSTSFPIRVRRWEGDHEPLILAAKPTIIPFRTGEFKVEITGPVEPKQADECKDLFMNVLDGFMRRRLTMED